MKIGNLIITTTKKQNELLAKVETESVNNYISNELPKIHDDIWNTAIDSFSKTPVGKAVAERKELEQENERLKEIEEEYNQLISAKKIINKFERV